MFLPSSKRAGKYLCCQGREYRFSDNDYKTSVSAIKKKSRQYSLPSEERVKVLR
jgi:hypothetical protein